MKKQKVVMLLIAAMFTGGIGGMLLSPAPVGAVAREIMDLLAGVTQLQQGQRDLTSSVDTKFAVMRTLIEQQNASTEKLNTTIGALQKTMQDLQANSGAQLTSMTTQVSGVSDNMGEIQSRLSKINQQLADFQNSLQGLDAKVSALAQPAATGNLNVGPGTVPGAAPGGQPTTPTNPGGVSNNSPVPPPSAEALYNSAVHDWWTKKDDLAQQEFQDYLKFFPNTDYASNAVFYLGEIAFSQQRYPEALDHYSDVLSNFPKSFKLATSLYKRGMTYLAMGKKPNGIADLREVVRRFPGTDEDKLGRAELKKLGIVLPPAGR